MDPLVLITKVDAYCGKWTEVMNQDGVLYFLMERDPGIKTKEIINYCTRNQLSICAAHDLSKERLKKLGFKEENIDRTFPSTVLSMSDGDISKHFRQSTGH